MLDADIGRAGTQHGSVGTLEVGHVLDRVTDHEGTSTCCACGAGLLYSRRDADQADIFAGKAAAKA